jgi:hypothetical protein
MPLKGNQYIFVGPRKILRLIRASRATSNSVIENNEVSWAELTCDSGARGCVFMALLLSKMSFFVRVCLKNASLV